MLFETFDERRGPLAARMRPKSLQDVLGQSHLLAEGMPLRRLIDGDSSASSVILYGPPGTGKTTLAQLIAHSKKRKFIELSATSAGVKEVREVIDRARFDLGASGEESVLFIDEFHRFSKAQQDALLPAVENGFVILVAATTENPSFSIIGPLLSRSLLVTLRAHTNEDLNALIDRAVESKNGLNGMISLELQARESLVILAQGDARRLLTYLEAASSLVPSDGVITSEILSQAIDRKISAYTSDSHYDLASALIKSIRGSDPDAAIHYLARLIEIGEDPRFISRRLVISASEDVGLADPSALTLAQSCADAVSFIGMPEARIPLAEVVIYLALAPKSNSAYRAIEGALADVQAGLGATMPAFLRDSNSGELLDQATKESRKGIPYRYPHDYPDGVVAANYLPEDLVGKEYYLPTSRGVESRFATALERIRSILRGKDAR